METRKFRHTHLKNLTCEIIEPTRKGYKVRQTETFSGRKKPKIITTYYNDIDFQKGRLWEELVQTQKQ